MKIIHIFLLFAFIATFNVVRGADAADDNTKLLQKQLKSKDQAVAYNATAGLTAQYRRDGDLKKAEKLLKNFQTPSGFDQLPRKIAIPYLRCLLETAHLRALNKDVASSLQLLNWATSRKNDYERAVSCLKYAEILVDLNEPVRADAFLQDSDKIVNKHLTGDSDSGVAIGQGSKTVDTAVAWRNLNIQSEYISAEVEELRLSKKFGSTYGLYVKLRRLQRIVKRSHRLRYYREAMRLCDEIAETDPESQFAQAAGYLKGQILFSTIPDKAGKLQKTAIRDAKTYLNKFIKANPEGLYRGEAWMLLGKISLEKEWNAKHAEKYYAKALAWFKAARTKRDALSLYAPLDNDLKKQTKATQRPTTLNRWKRTVYHKEDPLKLYNTASSPSWYVSDKEKNCLFMLGFLKFFNHKYKTAELLWKNAAVLDDNIMRLKASNWPNALSRLQSAAKYGKMAFTLKEKATFKNKKNKLLLQLAEMNYMLERFDLMRKLFEEVLQNPESNKTELAAANLGLGIYCDMTTTKSTIKERQRISDYFVKALEIGKGTALEENLTARVGFINDASTLTKKKAAEAYEKYLKKYPAGYHAEYITYRRAMIYLEQNDFTKAKQSCQKFIRRNPDSRLAKMLQKNIVEHQQIMKKRSFK